MHLKTIERVVERRLNIGQRRLHRFIKGLGVRPVLLDVCVLCSRKEGLPRVLLEAMLAGKPVVGSDVTGTRELIVHEETGLLYAFGDISALTAALRRLLGDAALRARMGAAGRARVAAGFSIEVYVAGVTVVLDEALA